MLLFSREHGDLIFPHPPYCIKGYLLLVRESLVANTCCEAAGCVQGGVLLKARTDGSRRNHLNR